MKKRFLALMMAGLMVLSSNIAVFAETEEAPEIATITWEEVAEQIADNESWDGEFVTFDEIAIQMYVPSSFEQVELSEEDREEGYIAYFTLGEEAAVGVQYVDMEGMELEEYAALLSDEYEISDIEFADVNGIGCISYTNPDDENVSVVALATQLGYIMEFSFSPITDEGFQAIAAVMTASIQNVPMEEGAEEAEEEIEEEEAEEE